MTHTRSLAEKEARVGGRREKTITHSSLFVLHQFNPERERVREIWSSKRVRVRERERDGVVKE
jgi:hypothetical protein